MITCTHEGHWTSAGLFPMQLTSGIKIMAIILCTNCGHVEAKELDVRTSGINVAQIKR